MLLESVNTLSYYKKFAYRYDIFLVSLNIFEIKHY